MPALLEAGGPVHGLAPGSGAALRAQFRAGKATLLQHFVASRPTVTAASRLTRALARHVDATIAVLWEEAGLPASAALVAVGGYGRAELFPYSDVDVLVLLPGIGERANAPADEALNSAIERFVTACWDIGLEIGSSVRTLAECQA